MLWVIRIGAALLAILLLFLAVSTTGWKCPFLNPGLDIVEPGHVVDEFLPALSALRTLSPLGAVVLLQAVDGHGEFLPAVIGEPVVLLHLP